MNITVSNPDARAVLVTSEDGGNRSVSCVRLATDVAVIRSDDYSLQGFGTADCAPGSELPEQMSFGVQPTSSRCVINIGTPNSVACDLVS